MQWHIYMPSAFKGIRGESFRSILLQLGEIRSILPEKIIMMALTATITQSVRMQLEKLFEMKDHVSIALNPCKPNITYFVSDTV